MKTDDEPNDASVSFDLIRVDKKGNESRLDAGQLGWAERRAVQRLHRWMQSTLTKAGLNTRHGVPGCDFKSPPDVATVAIVVDGRLIGAPHLIDADDREGRLRVLRHALGTYHPEAP